MTTTDPLEDKKAKARKISVKEGSAYSVMEGFGLRNITPYALAMGAKNTHIGILSSIPQLLGHLSQLFTLKLMKGYSRKKIVIFSVLLQAFLWMPLIGVGAYYFLFDGSSQVAAWILIFVYTLLIVAGLSLGPAWNSWMKDILSSAPGRYFGMRNRITGFVALVSMLIAGIILDSLKKTHLFLAFAIIFGIALIFRFVSASLFVKKHEPELKYEPAFYFSLFDFLKRMRSNNFGKFTIYVSLLMFATAIASPFFAVYMLKELHFNYVTFTSISIFSSLFSLLFMPAWGKFADRYGNIRIMKICGYLVPFVPFLWLLSVFFVQSPLLLVLYLIAIEAFSGACWAGFNLAVANFPYDAVTRQRMSYCIAYFNILQSSGNLVGALLGGFISSLSFFSFGLSPPLFIIFLSGIARLSVSLFFLRTIKEVRNVPAFGFRDALREMHHMTFKKLLTFFRH